MAEFVAQVRSRAADLLRPDTAEQAVSTLMGISVMQGPQGAAVRRVLEALTQPEAAIDLAAVGPLALGALDCLVGECSGVDMTQGLFAKRSGCARTEPAIAALAEFAGPNLHIFIDESGLFNFSAGAAAVSLVGALVITEERIAKVQSRYQKIRQRLPKENGEVKGRLLDEKDIAAVVAMLTKNDVLFEVVAIDMAAHTREGVQRHKDGQENGMTVHLTPEMHPSVHEGLWSLRRRLEKMPLQLYAQSVATFDLIATTVEHATMYYSQRVPKTLAQFRWVIDGKDKERVTDWEDWWSFTVMPAMQSRSLRQPIGHFVEGDYSYFKPFNAPMPDYLRPHMNNPNARTGTDIKKLMTEHFRFSSDPEPGLELVDILTNATRRALMGNLRRPGWQDIRRLMIHRKQHYVRLISLQEIPDEHSFPYFPVLEHFTSAGKSMLAPRFDRS